MPNEPIFVTRPFIPPLSEFEPYLKEIWQNKWLTNKGPFHDKLENELCNYLGVKHICLFTNGTLALITALQALEIKGEVITTPFSFVATSHSLLWNGITPVFCDIDETTCNLDPEKIEALITPLTSAILPVHVYGTPCEIQAIDAIAKKHHLNVIYDAAHAFGVKQHDVSIVNAGDLSILSFHATKIFNTFEGGAIVCHSPEMKQRIDYLKNFGFADEVTVIGPGINAKMNEIQSAFGLLHLKYMDAIIQEREEINLLYREELMNVKGVQFFKDKEHTRLNRSYIPILIEEAHYGHSRDDVYTMLKENNIFSRRYFYPLITTFSPYNQLPGTQTGLLPIAEKMASEILCMPIYNGLEKNTIKEICQLIINYAEQE